MNVAALLLITELECAKKGTEGEAGKKNVLNIYRDKLPTHACDMLPQVHYDAVIRQKINVDALR